MKKPPKKISIQNSTLIIVLLEATKSKVGLDWDATLRHAPLDHGSLVLGQGRVPCTEQEVIQVRVKVTGLGVDFGLVHLGRIVLPVSPDALLRK